MAPILDHADPRLGLRPATAAPQDVATRLAMRILGDTLAGVGAGLLCAPAVGVPVSLIALREADATSYLLNPRLRSLGPLSDVIGETSPHTGPVRRRVLRARSLVFEATDLSGTAQVIELAEGLAVQAQQAFELLHGHTPLDWLSPFHRRWLREDDPARRLLFESVGACLSGGGPLEAAQSACLRFGEADTVELRVAADDPAPVARVCASDPLRPVAPHQRLLLSLHALLPDLRHALYADPAASGLVLAVTLGFPGVVAHLLTRPAPWPETAFACLGLDRVSRRIPAAVAEFGGVPATVGAFEAIVLDHVAAPSAPQPDGDALRHLARAVSGASGGLFWAVPATCPAVEDRLQAAFPEVHAVLTGDATIYAAFKAPFDPGAARARLVMRAERSGARDLLDLLRLPWVHLRKDGRREVL